MWSNPKLILTLVAFFEAVAAPWTFETLGPLDFGAFSTLGDFSTLGALATFGDFSTFGFLGVTAFFLVTTWNADSRIVCVTP